MRAGTLVTLVVALASGPAMTALAQQDEAATAPEGNDSQNLDDRQSLTNDSDDSTFWDNYWYQPPVNGDGFQQPPAGSYQLEQPLAGSYQLEQPLIGTYQLQQPLNGTYQLQQPLIGTYQLQQPLNGTYQLQQPLNGTQQPRHR
ncbi:hypothetical protein [Corallococcus exercitus]|uniref:Uncharacterized protein n=1 Tax=Corallococcus exercitus TaxID=2316736 RepID=A0A7Y4JTN0_9BACT|nr:hypothetical protein [Corallococcus exercitus]NOK10653.1 hypothetical protein [Corallococcus exercitus]